jgi:hypothetical protein
MSIHEDQVKRWLRRYQAAVEARQKDDIELLESELLVLMATQRKDITYEMAKELAENL